MEPFKHEIGKSVLNEIIYPVIGSLDITMVPSALFLQIRSMLLPKYTISTCRSTMKNLRLFMERAVEEGYLKENPVTFEMLHFRNVRDAPYPSQYAKIFLSDEEIDKLNVLISVSPYPLPLYVAFVTCIPSEQLLALRWQDMDFAIGELCVSKIVLNSLSGVLGCLPPTSTRTMKMPSFVIDLMNKEYDKLMMVRRVFPEYNAENFMFTTVSGNRLGMEIKKELNAIGSVIGYPNFGYKNLMDNSLKYAIKCGVSVNYLVEYYSAIGKIAYFEEIYRSIQYKEACSGK